MRSNQARHCERSEAIKGMKGRSGSSGSPRRFAPRDDDSIRPHLALGLIRSQQFARGAVGLEPALGFREHFEFPMAGKRIDNRFTKNGISAICFLIYRS